ncbi:MAG TPA: chromosomal replication initiator protein DnaA [Phycisphaerales bacterium]|nr:chromosomal replication initiator protein DnaA [Phycisphaerales bacterium]HMP36049.1 chromosomal replication initiator protein DnaA [Phycisphaerales bacterium]
MARPEPEFRSAILAYLRKHRPEICRHWFDEIEPVLIASGTVFLLVREPVQLNFLRRNCVQPFTEAVQAITTQLVGVEFVDEKRAEELRSASGALAPRAPAGAGAESDDAPVLLPDNTFENFVVGPCNQLAHAASVAVAERPGNTYNPLFVHAGVGLGKTHLLQAICRKLLTDDPRRKIGYLSCNSFMERFTECVQSSRMSEFRHRFRGFDVLVIDDIHDLSRNAQSQEEFFHTFNELQQSGRQVILSSDAKPDEIPQIEVRLVSRFGSGLVAELERPCFETRKRILRRKAALRNLALPDDAVELIADRRHGSVRELENVLLTLLLHAQAGGHAITRELTLTVLGEHGGGARAITIHDILEVVSSYFNVRLAELTGRHRPRSIVLPRQVAMYLAKKLTHMSFADIGACIGGRDHTTVLHGYRTISERVAVSADLVRNLEQIEQHLQQRVAPQAASNTTTPQIAAG